MFDSLAPRSNYFLRQIARISREERGGQASVWRYSINSSEMVISVVGTVMPCLRLLTRNLPISCQEIASRRTTTKNYCKYALIFASSWRGL